MDYPTLKIFLDVVDEALPQLVVAGGFHSGAGLTRQQFNLFMDSTVEAASRLAAACEQLNYLYAAAGEGGSVLH
jgi:hypothetical protein